MNCTKCKRVTNASFNMLFYFARFSILFSIRCECKFLSYQHDQFCVFRLQSAIIFMNSNENKNNNHVQANGSSKNAPAFLCFPKQLICYLHIVISLDDRNRNRNRNNIYFTVRFKIHDNTEISQRAELVKQTQSRCELMSTLFNEFVNKPNL